MSSTLGYLGRHPLARRRPHLTYWRFARWQVESRLRRDVLVSWGDDAKLIDSNGMTGATGNIYCGLHEFADMAFTLHLLRPEDLFVDVGANVGSYTVLASAVCGAKTIRIEPDPETANHLGRNIGANRVEDRVQVVESSVGAASGMVRFSVGRDTTNHVLEAGDDTGCEIVVEPLDTIVGEGTPTLIKIDVEGYEPHVVAGAHRVLAQPTLRALLIETVDEEILAQLTGVGFRRARYEPFSRRLDWADAVVAPATGNTLFVRDLETCRARIAAAPRRRVLGQMI